MRLYFARKLFFYFFYSAPVMCFLFRRCGGGSGLRGWWVRVVVGWVRRNRAEAGCGFEVGAGARSNCAAVRPSSESGIISICNGTAYMALRRGRRYNPPVSL